MAALPNLNRQIRRYERHKKALDQAGQSFISIKETSNVFWIYYLNIYWKHNSDEEDDDELGSSESDSLSENINVETNDFVSEIQTSTSRESRSALLIFYYFVL